jgi:hypothetical protein
MTLRSLYCFADKTAVAIKCYECSVHPKRDQNGTNSDRLCTKFEDTKAFEVDCPFSTMCKKRLYRYQLINTVQESIERGCADQKNDSMVSASTFLAFAFCLTIHSRLELRPKQMGEGSVCGRAICGRLREKQRRRIRVLPLSRESLQFSTKNRSQNDCQLWS